MQLFGLSGDWGKGPYSALLDAAEVRGGFCILVLRRGASADCLAWVDKQNANLESKESTMRWPGTIVYDETDQGILLKFRVTAKLVTELRGAAESPFEWLGPELPEDLSFLRSDGRPWFVSIAHEQDAFFKLQSDEVEDIVEQLGNVELITQGEDQVPDECY